MQKAQEFSHMLLDAHDGFSIASEVLGADIVLCGSSLVGRIPEGTTLPSARRSSRTSPSSGLYARRRDDVAEYLPRLLPIF